MPCYSRIQKTKMTDANRLVEAMRAVGIEPTLANGVAVESKVITFYRDNAEEGCPFSTGAWNVEKLKEIQRKYAELSLRAWSKRTGYNVTDVDGSTYTLVNRRVK